MTVADTEAVVRDYVDACNREDVDRLMALLDPEVELHEAKTLPGAVSAVGFDAVRHYLERFSAHWRSFNWEPLTLEMVGDQALMIARLHLIGRESGVEVDREWAYVFTVRDGKLLRQDGYDDRAEALEALGRQP
jgi:ketosteroid isomerase-like protein